MAKTDDHEVCERFVIGHLTELHQQYDQCTLELFNQVQLCPSGLLSLETLDQSLKTFVDIQEKYIFTKMTAQLNRYQDKIHEKELFSQLMIFNLTVDQVN